MSILDKIEKDYEQAFKAREQNVVSTLRMLLAALKNEKIKKMAHLEDEDIFKVIKSELKKRREAIADYTKGNREDLATIEEKEAIILQQYLPAQLTEDDIRAKVKAIIAKAEDTSNLGKVMAAVMVDLKNQADGTLVRKIVEEELANK